MAMKTDMKLVLASGREITPQERANAIGVVAKESDARMLLEMLGIIDYDPLWCSRHSKYRIPQKDGRKAACWSCRHESRKAHAGVRKGVK